MNDNANIVRDYLHRSDKNSPWQKPSVQEASEPLMPCERKPDLDHHCERCGARIVRKRFPSGLLETYGQYVIRRTCGRTCQTKQAA